MRVKNEQLYENDAAKVKGKQCRKFLEPNDSGVEALHEVLRGALHGAKRRASQRVVAALMAGLFCGEEGEDFSRT